MYIFIEIARQEGRGLCILILSKLEVSLLLFLCKVPILDPWKNHFICSLQIVIVFLHLKSNIQCLSKIMVLCPHHKMNAVPAGEQTIFQYQQNIAKICSKLAKNIR